MDQLLRFHTKYTSTMKNPTRDKIHKAHADKLIRAYMLEHNLTPAKHQPVYKATKTGSDAVQSGYNDAMMSRWTDLRNFFCLIGDVESALMTDRHVCPEDPPPIKISSLMLYWDYYCLPEGTLLKKNGIKVKNIYGGDILAVGSWKAPINSHRCASYITNLNELYSSYCGSFKPLCKKCVALNNAESKS